MRTDPPEHDAVLRIQGEIVAALSQLTCVRRIISFGSVAQGRHDAWSDVDLWVVCDHVEFTAWAGAALIRRTKPVLFYRKFTAREQPSGRYWFRGESPVNRLDISFDSPEQLQTSRAHAITEGTTWAEVEVYTGKASPDPERDEALAGHGHPLAISDVETECGRRLYRALEATKHALRGQPFKWDCEWSLGDLSSALGACRTYPFAGGDFVAVAEACLRMGERVSGGR